jgi:diguanylate cyclase (GGDEF)-like protein
LARIGLWTGFPDYLRISHSLSGLRIAEDNARRAAAFRKGAAVIQNDMQAPRPAPKLDPRLMPTGPNAGQILRSVGDVAYEWKLDTDAITWSDNAVERFGVASREAIATGRAWAQCIEAVPGQSRFDAVTRTGLRDEGNGVPYQVQYALGAPNGEKTWLEDTGRWFAGADGLPARAHGIVRIVTERHQREAELERLAYYDAHTGEMNRNRLVETLAATLDESIRFRTSCGFLLVALDNLGQLNQAYGFSAADEAIVQVAKRIRTQMRGADHLGLFSGNKFGLILKNCTPEDLTVAADRLLNSVRNDTVQTSAGSLAVTITIGGVTAPRHARTVDEILDRAQDALDTARSRRHGSFQAYQPNVEREAARQENVRATDEIVAALNERRIAVAYEPVIEAASGHIAFYECLMRVRRADGSLAHANEIIPVAERLGLVRLLDHRVLEIVVQELQAVPSLRASVNVSPASTTDPNWWNGLGAMLKAFPGVGERLVIEITETSAIRDIDEARGFVARVKDLGCQIAIDDFGAGYTSFRNLRKLGVDIVKIDGAFIHDITRSEDDRAFAHTLIDLAHRLGLKTVAEWVKDDAAAELLRGWGCDYLQGELVGLASTDRPWAAETAQAASA